MKKIFFIMSAALAFFASCSSEDSENAGNVVSPTTFTATFEQSELDGISQKTVLADNGTSVNWESGDEIAVWYGSTKVKYVATPTETATTAKIVLAQGETIPQGTTPSYAVYPYSAATAYGEVTQPSAQTYKVGSFASGANVAYGTINEEKRTIYFKNLGSVVKVTLKNETAQPITYSNLQLTAGTAVAGTFSVSSGSVASSVSGVNTVTISPKEGDITVPANGNVACYFSIMTLGTSTTLKILASDQTLAEKASNIIFERNKIYPMKDITAKQIYQYVDLGLPSGIKWATMNIGASSPSEYGNYYQIGWTSPTTAPTLDCSPLFLDPTFQSTLQVPANYDVATINWGETWRMPTKDEAQELLDGCNWANATIGGHSCKVGTSKENGNTITLPCAGEYCTESEFGVPFQGIGLYAYYFTSTLSSVGTTGWHGQTYCFDGDEMKIGILNNICATPIRPVYAGD